VTARRLAVVAALLAACAGGRASSPAPGATRLAADAGLEPAPLAPGFAALRARFDADAARTRLLVLASPT
jgi:hypothetical protein